MEAVRSARLFLLQSRPSFNPSILTRQPQSSTRIRPQCILARQYRRTIASTSTQQQAGVATAEKETETSEETPAQQNPPVNRSNQQQANGAAAAQQSPEDVNNASTQRNQSAQASSNAGLEDLFKAFGGKENQAGSRNDGRLRETDYFPSARRGPRQQENFALRMNQPKGAQDPRDPGSRERAVQFNNRFEPKRPEQASQAGQETLPVQIYMPPDTTPAPFRLGPSLGRSIRISSQRADLAYSFRQLEISCSRNRVKQDFNKQRFHERPGLKRKRLHSERWRRRFKADFKAVCRRVEELRRKGW